MQSIVPFTIDCILHFVSSDRGLPGFLLFRGPEPGSAVKQTEQAQSDFNHVFMIENGNEYFYFLRIISLLIIILTRDKDVDQARRSTSRQCSLVNTIR